MFAISWHFLGGYWTGGGTQTCPLFWPPGSIARYGQYPQRRSFSRGPKPEGTHVINERCLLITRDGHRVVLVSGMPLAQYALGDRMSEAHAMVSLIDLGWADQNDVARGFWLLGAHGAAPSTTLRRGRIGCAGPSQRLSAGACPSGRPLGEAGSKRLKAQGCSHHEIARQLGVSVRAVRKTLRRLGWKAAPPRSSRTAPGPAERSPVQTSRRCRALSSPSSPASGGNPNLSAFSASAAQTPLPSSLRHRPERSLDGSVVGASGIAGGRRSVVWLCHRRAARRRALGLAGTGGQRRLRVCAEDLWQSGASFLWIAHQLAHAPAHGAVADQTPRGPQGTLASRLGARAGLGSSARSQDAAAQTGPPGGRRTRGPVWPGTGPAAGRPARSRSGFPLRRRPRAGLPRRAPVCPRPM